MPVSKAELTDAYRLILGREPEMEITESQLNRWANWRDMRATFLESMEAKVSLSNFAFDGFHEGSPHDGLRSAWIRTTTSFGRSIYVRLSDIYISREILLTGKWNAEITAAVLERMTPDSVFLDLGANIGWFTLLAADFIASRKGAGRVYAVEANPNVFPYLFASIVESDLAPYVSVRPYAVSNRLSTVNMDARAVGNLGGYGISGPEKALVKRNVVPAMTLDALFPDLERLDLVKIDIEGSEYLALEGGHNLLSRLKPAIIMEFNVERLAEVSRKSAQDVLDLMRSIGYRAYAIGGGAKRNTPEITDADLHDILRKNGNLADVLFTAR